MKRRVSALSFSLARRLREDDEPASTSATTPSYSAETREGLGIRGLEVEPRVEPPVGGIRSDFTVAFTARETTGVFGCRVRLRRRACPEAADFPERRKRVGRFSFEVR